MIIKRNLRLRYNKKLLNFLFRQDLDSQLTNALYCAPKWRPNVLDLNYMQPMFAFFQSTALFNPILTGCCHVTLIYGLIPPMAGRNRVKGAFSMVNLI